MEKIITSADNKIVIRGNESVILNSAVGLDGLNLATSTIAFKIQRYLLTGGTVTPLSKPLVNYIVNPSKQLNSNVVKINEPTISNDGYEKTEIVFENLGTNRMILDFNKLNQ